LYDIDTKLQNAIEFNVDENGEILEGEELAKKIDSIEMELNDKLVNIACLIKSLDAEAEAIKNEKMKLAKR
jgi:NTP pyrophosphatase (non-canonical NTP hydrolase)